MKKSTVYAVLVLLVGGYTLAHAIRKRSRPASWPAGVEMTLVVPWHTGGSGDAMARQLAQYWAPELGTGIKIVNIEGDATLAGTEYFLEQPADGTVLYAGTQMYLSAGAVLRGGGFDMDDFAILNIQQFDPVTITVLEDSPYRNLRDLVREIKARPGELRCGFVPGGAPHIASELLKKRLGLEYREVAFESGIGYRTALLGGEVDFIFSNAGGDLSIQNRARVLAVADERRSAAWPRAPTVNRALGMTDFPQLGSARFIAVRREVRDRYPWRYQLLVNTYQRAFENPDYVNFRASTRESAVSAYRGPDASTRMNQALHVLLELYSPPITPAERAEP